MTIKRRALPLLALAAIRADAPIRLGTLRFGSLAWELDTIRAHGLAPAVALAPVELATSEASLVALQANHVDIVLQDWIWVSRQRAAGADWTFSPASAALGAVIVPPASRLRTLADLAGTRLGIAGTPLDKSWLLLRAYAAKTLGLDLDRAVDKQFGPPPLLAQLLAAGRLDAMLTYWPFAARAEANGQRALFVMADALPALGATPGLPMLGYVFSTAWAAQRRDALRAFLDASEQARSLLAHSDPEWDRIAPLTGAASPAELAQLRAWYRTVLPAPWDQSAQRAAEHLYGLFAALGGPALVGPATQIAPGTFWPQS